ncbi:MAG: hypothetical protein AAGB04_00410 [Pseudomonadota bacterium]
MILTLKPGEAVVIGDCRDDSSVIAFLPSNANKNAKLGFVGKRGLDPRTPIMRIKPLLDEQGNLPDGTASHIRDYCAEQ